MLRSVFDVPSHPLFVHAPVVLIPLALLGAMALACRPEWRRKYAWGLVAITAIALIGVILAMESGERFADVLEGRIPPIDKHQSLADTTRIFVFLFFLTALATAVVDRRQAARPSTNSSVIVRSAPLALMALVVAFGALSTVWTVRTGHEGARLVWEGSIQDE